MIEAVHTLRTSGQRLKNLVDIADSIFIPPRFKRMYVEQEHGVPFLQGSHVVHFQPTDLKFLSRASRRLEQWIVRSGWILVTCSGTIGRTIVCPPEWDGWAASQHILRIIPNEKRCPAGYLCAFLSSPLGQAQLTANIYGAVVDELTEDQAGTILVPLPKTTDDSKTVRSIDKSMKRGTALKSKAATKTHATVLHTTKLFHDGEILAPKADSYTFPSSFLSSSNEIRLDAGHYSPELLICRRILEHSSMKLERLGNIVKAVVLPGRIPKRIYVEPDDGVPFLQGSHVVHFYAANLKHISPVSHPNMDVIRIQSGWLLVTRSGSVGRVAICPPEWDGWAASEHIIRVIPDERKCGVGYLCSFLASPLGQIQLKANIHGAVVDEVTAEQLENVLVPIPKRKKESTVVRAIDENMKEAIELKSKAVLATQDATANTMTWLREVTASIAQRDEELHISNVTAEQVTKALMSGGARPR